MKTGLRPEANGVAGGWRHAMTPRRGLGCLLLTALLAGTLVLSIGSASGAAVPAIVKDINPGTAGSGPSEFTSFGGKLFFTADDGTNGRALWSTDGTTAGTTLIGAVSDVRSLTVVGG